MIALAAIPVIGPALAFLTSPLGRIVGVGLIVGATYGAGAWKGHAVATAKCRAAALQSQLDAAQTDVKAARDAAAAAEQAREDIEKASADDKVRIAQYEDQLRKRPAASCALGDDDLRWLRGRNKSDR